MAKLRILCCVIPLAAALIALPPAAFAQAANPPSDSPTADAQKLLDTGRTEEALQALDALAQQQPEPAGVERLRGTAYYEQGNMPLSAAAFARALVQDPGDREAMQMEGVTLFRTGKPADAIPLLERAHLSIARTNIDSNYLLGLCYLDTRRYDDARRAFATQYKFPPDSASAYLLAARMMLRRDYLPVADSFAQKALALNPNLPMAHLLLGQIRLSQSHLTEAIAEFTSESALNPLYGEVYDRLGDAYLHQGDYSKAQEALDRAVLLEPNSAVPYTLLGKVLVKQQDPLMAKLYLDKAVSIDPGNYTAHTLLGQVYRSLGQAARASHEFQVAEQLQADAQPKLETVK
jgi:tetratricopeptide (TPR) repeat protein